jgi:hypothetical protein
MEATMGVLLQSGCACDAVRVEITDVFDAGYCHCNRCLKQSGAPVFAFVHVPRAAFKVQEAQITPWPRRSQGSATSSPLSIGAAYTSIWVIATCCLLPLAAWTSLPAPARLFTSA